MVRPDRTANSRISGELERASHADLRYRLLIAFSCVIATLGLIADSTAVVIGAMLVAPLLTPMMGIAMASLGGRAAMLRSAAIELAEGVMAAVLLSTLLAWLAKTLPFDALATLPGEAQARTRPNPFDLGIALAGGAVGAYVLARLPGSDALPGVAIATALMPPLCTIGIGIAIGDRGVWGGAALLFVTNLSAIVFAATLMFTALGFRPARGPRNLKPHLALLFVLMVATALVYLTLRAVSESREAGDIRAATTAALDDVLPGSQLVEIKRSDRADSIELRITARTVGPVRLEEVEAIQARIAQDLQKRISVVFVSVPVVTLDPLNPPAPNVTITAVPRPTSTPTPAPTVTSTPTATPTPTPTRTPAPTVTPPVTGNGPGGRNP